MPLTPQEQHELDSLELQELEEQEKSGRGQGPSPDLAQQQMKQSHSTLDQVKAGLGDFLSKGSWDNAAKKAADSWSNLQPEDMNRLALAGLPVPISPAIGAVKGLAQKAASAGSEALNSGAASDMVGVISPRLGKLLDFFSKMKTTAAPVAPQVEQSVLKKAIPAANKNWDFPVR